MPNKRKAFRLKSLFEVPKSKIRCLAYSSNEIFVGTADGKLLAFARGSPGGGAPQREVVIAKKKKVDQVICVEALGRVLVLCNGAVSVHDLRDLSKIATLSKAKGASVMAVDQKGEPSFRLCVAAKRTMRDSVLHLFEYSHGEFASTKELYLPELPQTLLWNGKSICVGYTRKE